MDSLTVKNINTLLHQLAMLARGAVMAKETTKNQILEHIRIKGNEEFEKVFSMSEMEVCLEMIKEMSETDFDSLIEKIKGEEK